MRWLLLGAIGLYRMVPPRFRRQCLFKESCSRFVATVTAESGWRMGLRALRKRVLQCRPGYVVSFDDRSNTCQVRFADGSIAIASEVADYVLDPYRRVVARFERADPSINAANVIKNRT